jgi:hypothetical protein
LIVREYLFRVVYGFKSGGTGITIDHLK